MNRPLLDEEDPSSSSSSSDAPVRTRKKYRYVSYGQRKGGRGEEENGGFCSNEVVTAKYTVANFTFKFLMEEFSKVANVYFLVVCALQMVPQIR